MILWVKRSRPRARIPTTRRLPASCKARSAWQLSGRRLRSARCRRWCLRRQQDVLFRRAEVLSESRAFAAVTDQRNARRLQRPLMQIAIFR
jgi:hypothetical protein